MLTKTLIRTFVLSSVSLLYMPTSVAQKVDTSRAVQWSARVRPSKSATSVNVAVTAAIQPGWHLYALDQEQGGPVPTMIRLASGQPFTLAGPVKQPDPIMATDPNFDMPVRYFEQSATFSVPLTRQAASKSASDVTLEVSYQTCNDRFCLPVTTAKVQAHIPAAAR
ncbi:MAG TPA: protein-disulfide reductase DsbD N-terminal domain-containing protein [Candidatus Koribacter sp.]